MKKIALSLSILATLNTFAATDGTLDSSESVGNIDLSLNISSEILITRLDDISFTNVTNQSALLDSYSDTKQTSFCVYTNNGEFTLTVEPSYNAEGLKNEDYTKVFPSAPNDNIPVTFSLLNNPISGGAISGLPVIVGSTFTNDHTTANLTQLLDIMNQSCNSKISGDNLDNYILSANVAGSDIKAAAAGYYSANVIVRASIPIVMPQ